MKYEDVSLRIMTKPHAESLERFHSMIKFFSNMLILLSLLKNKNILYILLNQVLMFFRRKKLDN